MALFAAHTGQWLTIFIMAVALGMDAFSLGIGYGMRGIRLRRILSVSLVIAAFHMVMPLLGIAAGHYASSLLGNVAVGVGGGLLILLGGHMIYSSLTEGEQVRFMEQTFWGMLLFALSVSVDSFSVGVSLGLFSTDVLFTVLMFGLLGGILSILGLMLGRRVSTWAGRYGEALGGIVLLVFGIKFII